MSYLDMVEGIVLGLLQASREGDWDLHLHSVRMMIPWCFAYDKVNYSRYLTPYFAQMTNLGDKNAEEQKTLRESSFSVQLASSNPFGRIPVDQKTEVTVNKAKIPRIPVEPHASALNLQLFSATIWQQNT